MIQKISHFGGIHWDTSYFRLPSVFYHSQEPTGVSQPQLVALNSSLAQELGLDAEQFQSEMGAQVLAGNVLVGDTMPLAQAYSGHQFGHFTRLGDGRAILLGEHITPSGRRVDFHLKGSGRTPFSRGGDGRAALGPMLREFLISEAMHALGIPTTRSLAVVLTGEPVFRDRILPGAILCRIASSHLRVGTFEFAAEQTDTQALQALVKYAYWRHCGGSQDAENRPIAEVAVEFFRSVVQAQAQLVAQWLSVGFIHGVMNTDNMTISGETIDYGPCAFMDELRLNQVFSSIDRQGRYAYIEQPKIAQWNLACFAESLALILDREKQERISQILTSFAEQFNQHWLELMRKKLGLVTQEPDDLSLVQELLGLMHSNQLDYPLTWIALTDSVSQTLGGRQPTLSPALETVWLPRWQARLQREQVTSKVIHERMKAVNPVVTPRNYRVEAALHAAESGDFELFNQLLSALQNPFEDSPANRTLGSAPDPNRAPYQTFCGT